MRVPRMRRPLPAGGQSLRDRKDRGSRRWKSIRGEEEANGGCRGVIRRASEPSGTVRASQVDGERPFMPCASAGVEPLRREGSHLVGWTGPLSLSGGGSSE